MKKAAVLSVVSCLLLFLAPRLAARPLLGSPAPSFRLSLVGGGTFDFDATVRDQPLLLVFFRTDCGHCQEELPVLERLAALPGYKPVRILAVSVKESAETVQAYWQAQGLTLPVAADEAMEVSRLYGVSYVPRLFQIRRGGLLVGETGQQDEGALREILRRLIRPADCLLVVPRAAKPSGRLLAEAVVRAGYQPDVHGLDVDGPLSEAVLSDYRGKVAIRSVPSDEEASVVGAAEAEQWEIFCNDGGNLLVAGHDAIRTLHQTPLAEYYLLVNCAGDDAKALSLKGVAGSPSFGGLSLELAEKTEEGGPTTPDLLAPIDVCVGILAYETADGGRPRGFGGVLAKT